MPFNHVLLASTRRVFLTSVCVLINLVTIAVLQFCVDVLSYIQLI